MRLQLKVRNLDWDHRPDDDEVRERLVDMVRKATVAGKAPVVCVVVRGLSVEVVSLEPILQARLSVPWFLAGMSRSVSRDTRPDAIGLMGVFTVRNHPDAPPVKQAMVFLEWHDNRWWQWRALLEPDGKTLRPRTETEVSAMDGDAMPSRLGRWWSLGRRANLSVQVERVVH